MIAAQSGSVEKSATQPGCQRRRSPVQKLKDNCLTFMIAIDNKLVSDHVIEEQFVCDLNKCKGGCCEDGDAGAPTKGRTG